MNIKKATWYLSQECPVCNKRDSLVVAKCPACGTAVVICNAEGSVFTNIKLIQAQDGKRSAVCPACSKSNIGDFTELNSEEIQQLGFGATSYH